MLGLLCVAVVAHRVMGYPDRATGSARGTVEVEIPRGAGAQKVSQLLAEAGLIERPAFFRLYAGQRGAASRFRPGHYKVEAPVTTATTAACCQRRPVNCRPSRAPASDLAFSLITSLPPT